MKQVPVRKKVTNDLLKTMRNLDINEYFSVTHAETHKCRIYAYSIKTMENKTFAVNKLKYETRVTRIS